MKHIVRFHASKELLASLLGLPAGARILTISGRGTEDFVSFIVDDPALPETPSVWHAMPTVTRNDDGTHELAWGALS